MIKIHYEKFSRPFDFDHQTNWLMKIQIQHHDYQSISWFFLNNLALSNHHQIIN
jgi:hypothetical protein